MNYLYYLLALCCLCIIVTGCDYSVALTNYEEFTIQEVSGNRNLRLAILPYPLKNYTNDSEIPDKQIMEQTLFLLIQNGLWEHPDIRTICVNQTPDQREFDYYISIDSIQVSTHGSMVNYFVTFPGCIFMTCLWAGYRTSLDVDTQITVYDGKNQKLETVNIPATYKFRHCDKDRAGVSLAIGTGWVLAPFMGIAHTCPDEELIGNVIMASLKKPYGEYVAHKIVALLK